MTPADQETLRTIEESCREEFVELPDNTPTNSNPVPSEPDASQASVPQPSAPIPPATFNSNVPIPPDMFGAPQSVSSAPGDDDNDDDDFLLF